MLAVSTVHDELSGKKACSGKKFVAGARGNRQFFIDSRNSLALETDRLDESMQGIEEDRKKRKERERERHR